MGRLALWVAQATTSTTPSNPIPGGPDGGPRGGFGALRDGLASQGPGTGPGRGSGAMMRGGAEQFGRHMDNGDHHWWMFILVLLAFLIIAGLLVWAIVAFTRATKLPAPEASTPGPTARRLLDERLASGDIDPADYEARRKLLDG